MFVNKPVRILILRVEHLIRIKERELRKDEKYKNL